MINSKLPKVGTTIFTKMSLLARQNGAINLSQGFPDFSIEPNLSDYLEKATRDGANQYAPMEGLLSLREQIAQKYYSLYNISYSADEVVITAGATQAIFTAIASVISKGDEVIIFTPAYDCYAPAVELFGGVCKYLPLKSPDFLPDWERFRNLITKNTKLVIINTPHNPTGSILFKDDLKELERMAEEFNFLVLSDEVYEHIIFNGNAHESVSKYPNLKKRSFVVASFGKTFHITGWKVGYCVGPKELMIEFKKVHQFNVFCVNHPAQAALSEYFKTANFASLSMFYQQKRDFFSNQIKDSKLELLPSLGTYFLVADYSKVSTLGDVEFCEWMTKEKGLAAIPLSVFYDDLKDEKLIRLCFAKKEETLETAASVINTL